MKWHNLITRSLIVLVVCSMLGWGFVTPLAQEGTVKIGAIYPLTGASSQVGSEMEVGAKIACKEINEAGGVLGKELELIIEDSESRPAAGVEAAHKLIDIDKVPAVMGAYSSSVTIPIQEYAQQQGVLAWAVASSSPKIREIGDYCFNSGGLDDVVAPALSRFAYHQGYRKAVVLAPNNDFGRGAAEYAKKGFEAAGGEILDLVLFKVGKASYKTEIRRVFESDPPAILYTAYGGDSRIIAKEIYEMGLKDEAQFYDLYLSMCTGDAILKTVVGHRGLESWNKGYRAERLHELFMKKTGHYPRTPYAGYAYDTVWLVALTMNMSHSTDPAKMKEVAPVAARIYYGVTGGKSVDQYGQQRIESKGRCRVTSEKGEYSIECPDEWQGL